jgi:hypothetical protein
MKNSFVYRTVQVVSLVVVYAMASVWASTNHVDNISNLLTNVDSLLVILAIAVVLPYLCFKALSKIYTPPVSRSRNEDPLGKEMGLNQDEIAAFSTDEDLEKMQYRGTLYKPDDVVIRQTNMRNENSVIKYRGAIIDADIGNSDRNLNNSVSEPADSLSPDGQSQKSAKPKERMKYRGSYVD